jgi:6-phosphogluconolactonase
MTRFANVLLWVVLLNHTALAEKIPVWVGMSAPQHGEHEGIYRTTLDTTTGAIEQPALVAEIKSPGFLVVRADGKRLYSACNLPDGSGGAAAFEITDDGRTLRLLNTESTGDGEPAHVALDKTGRLLFTAQYGGGTVTSFPLAPDGRIQPRAAYEHHAGSGPNRQRQEGPHPHWVGTDPKNKFLFVPDLGTDRVVIYQIDAATGALKPHGSGQCPAGSGPRHLVFHPNGKFAYVVNELQESVTAFQYDPATGSLKAFQTIDSLPKELREVQSTGAEIYIHPSGRFLYASNRGHDSITVFTIDRDNGRLSFIEREPIRGSHPRSFNIDPTGKWLLAAGRDSNTIAVFKIDPNTGGLIYAGHTVNSPSPICIEFQPGK